MRIACRELEAFYLGDLPAVESGLGISGLAGKQDKVKFREPDQLIGPSRELLKLTNNRYQKIAGSRAIAPHLNLLAPRSRSFHHLIQAIRRASDELRGSARQLQVVCLLQKNDRPMTGHEPAHTARLPRVATETREIVLDMLSHYCPKSRSSASTHTIATL